MASRNFDFLRPHRPELADLAGFAERYTFEDPIGALLKLRSFAETLTWDIYRLLQLRPPVPDDFMNLLTDWQFKSATPKLICDQLHALRKAGNKAAHANEGDTQTVLVLLEQSWQLAAWYAVRFHGTSRNAIGAFARPTPTEPSHVAETRLRRELEQQRQQLDATLAELQAARAQYEAAERKLDELQSIAQTSENTLHLLQFDEATTRRRLIDVALAQAGWDVGLNGSSTAEVSQEFELTGQPTPTGKGYADYVLWGEDGRPLAVIEAKRTMKDAEQGRKQAELYANALEAQFGSRPMVFYTNGHEIHVWDDAAGYPPRKLFGFYSQDTLQYRAALLLVAPRKGAKEAGPEGATVPLVEGGEHARGPTVPSPVCEAMGIC